MTRNAVVLAISIAIGTPAGASAGRNDIPPISDLLERAGTYVRRFESTCSVIVGDEYYRQDLDSARGRGGATFGVHVPDLQGDPVRHRETRSEMLFMWTPQEGAWFGLRNVLMVTDNAAGWRMVRDSTDRIAAILKSTAPGQRARLRELADENARFNLGHGFRNISTPTLTVQFLDPSFQPRFQFAVAGEEAIHGTRVIKMTFAERQTPTVITGTGGADSPASGFVWIQPSDGAVVRTSLKIVVAKYGGNPAIRAAMQVDYRHDATLDVWLPSQMTESYEEAGQNGERVHCVATYSNFHAFETSARVIAPK